MKQKDELASSLPNLIKLMTQMIEQNNLLIEQAEAREQYLLQIIEQNNELLAERDDFDAPSSPFLDG